MTSVLERLAGNIFREPYASEGKIKGVFTPSFRMPKSVALTKPVIQINGPRKITYLSFDIDREFGGIAWDDCDLPAPNLIVVNPKNLHAHLIYELAEPIWLRKPDDIRKRDALPVRFMKAVQAALGKALQADSSYNGLLVKNPFHHSWRVSSARERPYTLGELSEHLDLESVSNVSAVVRESTGRRATLFDSIRYWAYQEKSNHSSLVSFHEAIMAELERLNNGFEKGPEAFHTIKSIAKSVSEWVWTRYERKRTGIMNLDSSEPIRVRQQKGQQFTSRLRVRKTLDRIRDVVTGLVARGVKITKTLVAALSGFSRGTVRGYWNEISLSVTQVTEGLRPKSSQGPSGAEAGGFPDGDPTHHATGDQTRTILARVKAARLAHPGETSFRDKLKHAISQRVDMWRTTRLLVNEEYPNQRTT